MAVQIEIVVFSHHRFYGHLSPLSDCLSGLIEQTTECFSPFLTAILFLRNRESYSSSKSRLLTSCSLQRSIHFVLYSSLCIESTSSIMSCVLLPLLSGLPTVAFRIADGISSF